MSASAGRPRWKHRALAALDGAPVAGSSRERIAAAIELCSETERHVLALMVAERLTPIEAAHALELPVGEIVRIHSTLLTELRRALRGRPFRPRPRSDAGAPRTRRAS
ncbi:MAG: hypothetical protein HYR73_08860 [Candidatus Eisenbacteria bacterium]|nr:hypothetical protein [Candidatus Eisenbacteria bacterium]